jgi:uncharacterized membrane protein
MIRLVIASDLIIIATAVIATWLSVRLICIVNRGMARTGWWTILPFVLAYAVINRILTLMVLLGWIQDPLDVLPASMVVFWVGFAVFMYGIVDAAYEIMIQKNYTGREGD